MMGYFKNCDVVTLQFSKLCLGLPPFFANELVDVASAIAIEKLLVACLFWVTVVPCV